MKRSLLLLAGMFCFASVLAQPTNITIDADFSDWTADLPGVIDTPEVTSDVDILSFQVTNDADFLYVHVVLADEIDLTEDLIPHNLRMFIDADNDAGTGFNPQAGYGSELGIVFRDRFAYYDVIPESTVTFSDFQFRPAPTVSGNEFEFAIGRDVIPDGVNPLFSSETIKILLIENNGGDRCPNNGSVFAYTFNDDPIATPDPTPFEKVQATDLRFVTYNVLANGLTNGSRQDAIRRQLQAVDPDIIGFQEVGSVSTSAAKTLLDDWLPLDTPDGWYLVKDEDMITASPWPFIETWPSLSRQFPALIDLPAIYGADLLLVNAHLSCCGNNDGRQDQVDSYIEWLSDAMTVGGSVDLPEFTPIVYLGDLNLVGYASQLNTLLTGDIVQEGTYGADFAPDWDGTSITEALCIQSDKRMHYSWRNDAEDNFPPGKLDFIMYSDAVIDLSRSYAIQTEVMPADRLALYGLNEDDTSTASDHFPVVADFALTLFADADNDGVIDELDNCVDTPNADQADWNNDGAGDACSDSDGDGLLDDQEINTFGTDPGLEDSDNDGLTDGEEVNVYGTLPLVQDSDGDGLTDWLEISTGIYNPLDPDTNNNGCNDADEFSYQCGDSPCSDCVGDLDNNGIVNAADLLVFLGAFGLICE
ncbi:MAG: endonuclease/exonuclease/phosphatase family protein [Flavobacteriales bacterium]|nr:endonuclease/exonuclease/phosphatase family protein [Flavobacteriales bacterium]